MGVPFRGLAPHIPLIERMGALIASYLRQWWWAAEDSNLSTPAPLFHSQRVYNPPGRKRPLAEREGFEPPDPFGPSVFETAAISRTLPPLRDLAEAAGFEPAGPFGTLG